MWSALKLTASAVAATVLLVGLAGCGATDEDPQTVELRQRVETVALALTETIWTDAYRLTSTDFRGLCDLEAFATAMINGSFGTGFVPSRAWVVQDVSVMPSPGAGQPTRGFVTLRLIRGPDNIVREPPPTPFVREFGEWLWDLDPQSEEYCDRDWATG